jgi:hypothetical protein
MLNGGIYTKTADDGAKHDAVHSNPSSPEVKSTTRIPLYNLMAWGLGKGTTILL